MQEEVLHVADNANEEACIIDASLTEKIRMGKAWFGETCSTIEACIDNALMIAIHYITFDLDVLDLLSGQTSKW